MVRAVIHVGMAKTGTTHLQQFLARNVDNLDRQGMAYPTFLGEDNHKRIAIGFSGADGRIRQRLGVLTDDDLLGHRETLSAAMTAAVEANPNNQWIFSSEYLSERLRQTDSVDQFRQWMSNWFDQLEIVIYLRRQDFTAPSAYSTYVKSGGSECWGPAELTGPRFDLDTVVNRWRTVFGSANVKVRPYLEPANRKIDLIDDFVITLGMSVDDSWLRPTKDANLRLAANAVEALRLANLADRREGRALTGMERRRRIARMVAEADGPGWMFPLELVQQVRGHFESDNRRLVETFDDSDGSWQAWLAQDSVGQAADQPVVQPDQVSHLLTLAHDPTPRAHRRLLRRLRRT